MTGTSFPEFITSRRRELDLTLGDVASRLGVSPITVSNWSNGDSRPKPEKLVALADLLEVPAEELADMAGITLGAPEASVNLMPNIDQVPEPGEPLTEEIEVDEPVAAVVMSDPSPAVQDAPTPDEPAATAEPPEPEVEIPDLDAGLSLASDTEPPKAGDVEVPDADEVPIPVIEAEPVPVAAAVGAAAAATSVSVDTPGTNTGDQAPDSVPAFVTAPETEPTAKRRPSIRRPARRPAGDERLVTVLPLTYIEDPRQIMRYRIRWALTVVVLVIMFFILLWASRELLSALSEVKQAVTPGGIGSG